MFHPKQQKKTFPQTRVNAMLFQLRCNRKVLGGKNDQLIINTMAHTVNGVSLLLAQELMAYNRSVE